MMFCVFVVFKRNYFYLISKALSSLDHFKSYQKKPTAWKCGMELGDNITIPIVMYAKVMENKGNLKFETVDKNDDNKVVVTKELK